MADPDEAEQSRPLSRIEVHRNPILPIEIRSFRPQAMREPVDRLTVDEWLDSLHGMEIKDKLQQIKLRPFFAAGVFVLIIVQTLGVWMLMVRAMQLGQLPDLQLVFATLVAGTLTESYFILRFVTTKVFSDIDYHNKDGGQR